MAIVELTPAQRRALRARAHALKPSVIVGAAGLTPGLLTELDRTLKSHELIKVKTAGERADRDTLLRNICDLLDAAPVQHIGRILVIFREKPQAAAPQAEPRKPPQPPPRRRKPAIRRALRRLPSSG